MASLGQRACGVEVEGRAHTSHTLEREEGRGHARPSRTKEKMGEEEVCACVGLHQQRTVPGQAASAPRTCTKPHASNTPCTRTQGVAQAFMAYCPPGSGDNPGLRMDLRMDLHAVSAAG